MKYILMLLCASLFSVLASADGTDSHQYTENPGGRATYASNGEAAISPEPCNCNANGDTAVMGGRGAPRPNGASAVAPPTGKAKSAN